MKKTVTLLFVTMICFLLQGATAEELPDPRTMTFPSVTFEPPEVKRAELKNGLRIYILENHELPLVHAYAIFRTGSVYEPEGKEGLAMLAGESLRSGGAGERNGDELDEALSFMAADLSTDIGLDLGEITLDVLSSDLEEGFSILADVLLRPRFDEEKLELDRERLIDEVRRQNDEPGQITSREFRRLLYPDHPYGSTPTATSLRSITRSEVKSFYSGFSAPQETILAIAGDVNTEQVIQLVREKLGGWKKRKIRFPKIPPVKPIARKDVFLISREMNQTHIRMGHLGIDRWNKDRHALEVMNFILGGSGFTSRLMNSVRTESGLAYSVGSHFQMRDLPGPYFTYCQTKSETTVQALTLIQSILAKMRDEGPTAEELRIAKESLSNSHAFNFDTPQEIVDRYAGLEYRGFKPDQLKKDLEAYKAVTLDDARKAARKYLQPDKMVILTVGNPDTFDESLETLGEVQELKIDSSTEEQEVPSP